MEKQHYIQDIFEKLLKQVNQKREYVEDNIDFITPKVIRKLLLEVMDFILMRVKQDDIIKYFIDHHPEIVECFANPQNSLPGNGTQCDEQVMSTIKYLIESQQKSVQVWKNIDAQVRKMGNLKKSESNLDLIVIEKELKEIEQYTTDTITLLSKSLVGCNQQQQQSNNQFDNFIDQSLVSIQNLTQQLNLKYLQPIDMQKLQPEQNGLKFEENDLKLVAKLCRVNIKQNNNQRSKSKVQVPLQIAKAQEEFKQGIINEQIFARLENQAKKVNNLQGLIRSQEFETNYIIKQAQGQKLNTLVHLDDGQVVVGGRGKELLLIDESSVVGKVNLTMELRSAFTIKNILICGLWQSFIEIFDVNSWKRIDQLQTKESVRKMIIFDENFVILGEWNGYLEIYDLELNKIIQRTQLSQKKTIWDIFRTTNPYEYVVSFDNGGALEGGGLQFIDIKVEKKKFVFHEKELFFKNQNVLGTVEIKKNTYLVCIQGETSIKILDRGLKQVRKIDNPSASTSYNSIQLVIGYDENYFPYVFYKDDKSVNMINTKTYEVIQVFESKFDDKSYVSSLLQMREKNNLKILTIDYDNQKSERTIQEVEFASVYK